MPLHRRVRARYGSEEELVQSLADSRWRLLRIPGARSQYLLPLVNSNRVEKSSAEADSVSVGLIQGTPSSLIRSNSIVWSFRKPVCSAASKRK